MPVRRPSNHGDNIVSWFSSHTTGTSIGCESDIEYSYLHLADFDPAVVHIEEQPCTIPYQHDGRPRGYTPDFLLRLADGQRVLVECKPAARVADAPNQRKFAAARAWCATHGYRFLVVTDEELERGGRLRNVKWLAQFRGREGIEPQVEARLLALLAGAAGPLPLGRIEAELLRHEPAAAAIRHIFHLVYHQRIIVALDDARITRDTLAWLPVQPAQ